MPQPSDHQLAEDAALETWLDHYLIGIDRDDSITHFDRDRRAGGEAARLCAAALAGVRAGRRAERAAAAQLAADEAQNVTYLPRIRDLRGVRDACGTTDDDGGPDGAA